MTLTECKYLPDPTYTYFEGEDLVLEYREFGVKGTGVIFRCHKGVYKCYQIAFDSKACTWSQSEEPITLTSSEVVDWFETNYNPDFYHDFYHD